MLEQRFGDFQGKPFRFASGDLENAADRGEQVVRAELVWRQVDGDRQNAPPVLVPVTSIRCRSVPISMPSNCGSAEVVTIWKSR